jgi:hypothetical protein
MMPPIGPVAQTPSVASCTIEKLLHARGTSAGIDEAAGGAQGVVAAPSHAGQGANGVDEVPARRIWVGDGDALGAVRDDTHVQAAFLVEVEALVLDEADSQAFLLVNGRVEVVEPHALVGNQALYHGL